MILLILLCVLIHLWELSLATHDWTINSSMFQRPFQTPKWTKMSRALIDSATIICSVGRCCKVSKQWNYYIILKFNSHLSSSAAEMAVKFQCNYKIVCCDWVKFLRDDIHLIYSQMKWAQVSCWPMSPLLGSMQWTIILARSMSGGWRERFH